MNEQEKKWEEEAKKIFLKKKLYKNFNCSIHDYILGYLQACKVRQEEIERLEEIIKQRNISLTVYEEK